MLFLGHMGIGYALFHRWRREFRQVWFLFGSVLPDLIDKPLFYGLKALQKTGISFPLISGTRTIGHSAWLLLSFAILGIFRGSRKLMAISLGIGIHLVLDTLGDGAELLDQSATIKALLFPFVPPSVMPHSSMFEHVHSKVTSHYIIYMEILGAALLLFYYWRDRRTFRRSVN